MKSIKEKQFLVNMALALGQTPDPALVKEIDDHNKLMESITVKGDEFGSLLAQLAQLKDEVETVKSVAEVKQQYFEPKAPPKEYPKPPTLEELMSIVPEEVFEPAYEPDDGPLTEDQIEQIEEVSPLIAAASSHITKEVQMEANSFQQPEPTDPILRSVEDLKKKIKFLEGWISKISMTGPGGGEVNLLKLDDVDTSAIGNGKYLRYNAANAKMEFATVSGGGGGAVDSVNGQTGEVTLTTANVAEVYPNLYFTDDRALGAFTPGNGIDIAANGLISATVSGGGSVDLTAVSTAIIPVADSIQDLGTANLRWGTLYLANNTIDLGGSLISSDGTGTITISSQGAVLPVNSKVAVDGVDKNIALVGNTGAIATVVPFYTKELGLNTTATNFTFGANPDDYVFTNFFFNNGTTITQSARAQFYF
ncbi:hypothetical protein UFOVP242_55 [uncultured Caudovirales phage]|uniref:Uncharacterized protein n=1 Tax=uncultured Caudovirales phage TaxID=2100421 RepID=A0A6J7WUJ3_9CAUD|nr:hypothetical protein UFOVP242_55 [uncultured Caudovirales phage]